MWSLYRKLLKYANDYPSIRKQSIINAIKEDFREKSKETDEKKIANYIADAEGGLRRLQAYSTLNNKGTVKMSME